MNVTLPNGKVIKDVPAGTSKEAIKQKAILAGLATEADFSQSQLPQEAPATTQQIDSLAQDQSGFDTALISAGKGFADVLRGVGLMDEADETERRAFDALKKARPITATVGEIAGQALPFAVAGGPLVAGVASTGGRVGASAALGALEGGVVSRGQGEDVAKGALTGAALGAGGQVVGEAIDVARRLTTGKSAQNAAVDYATANKLPLTTTDVVEPKSALGKGLRIAGEEIPITGTSGLRASQQSAREAELQKLKELYPEVTDDAIYKSFMDSNNKYMAEISKRYDSIGSAMGDVEIPISKTVAAIDSELDSLTKGGRIQNKATIARLQEIKDDLASGPQTYKSMRDNRTFVREELRPETSNTQADRVIERVYAAMTDDIGDAVAKNAGPEAAFKLKQVDQIFAIEKKAQKKTKLKNILANGDVKPEAASKMIFSTEPSDVKQAYSALDKQGRANARAAIINKALEKAGDSPEKFLSAMKQHDNQFGVFFKGAERKQLQGLQAYLDATRRAAQSKIDPPTGRRAIPLAMFGGVVSDVTTSGGAATAGFATIGAMSRAYESKPVRSAMLRLANTPKGSEAYQNAVNAVNSALIAAQNQQEEGN